VIRRRATSRRVGAIGLGLAIGLVAAACGRAGAVLDGSSGDPTLAAIRGEIFNNSCALGSCHARPTLAARLDLQDNGLCRLLVSRGSCLFPDKQLVVPGKPEVSFLMDKLRGIDLVGTPDEDCGTSNLRMPLGQSALPAAKLAQVEEWIRAGADCGGDVPADGGVDTAPDAAAELLADVEAIAAATTTLQVGDQTAVTVRFTRAAPSTGQILILDVEDSTILGVPNSLQIEPGVSSVTFQVVAKLAGSATITASSGTNSKSLTITVAAVAAIEGARPHARQAARRLLAIAIPRTTHSGS
jgi:hypothetical protein